MINIQQLFFWKTSLVGYIKHQFNYNVHNSHYSFIYLGMHDH